MLLILPLGVFLALNDPHDCFVCLGRDPDRIYSTFQLTLEERTRRRMVAKYSTRLEKKMTSDPSFIESLLNASQIRRNSTALDDVIMSREPTQVFQINPDVCMEDVYEFGGSERSD